MEYFDRFMNDCQVQWRLSNIKNQMVGSQKGKIHQWILPLPLWEEGLWAGIRNGNNSLSEYLIAGNIRKHDCAHNLKSSWILCANLYFPFRNDTALVSSFLQEMVSPSIKEVEKIELDYEDPEEYLHPEHLLGEPRGLRGRNQTSPEIAFVVKLAGGKKGLVLTGVKFTEQTFYGCPGRKKKNGNPDPGRCLNFELVYQDTANQCYQCLWQGTKRKNRKYWDYLSFTPGAINTLKHCPASTSGCQLFHLHALAEALAIKGPYDLVVAAVAYDERNQTLIRCLQGTGIDDFTTGWGPLFNGKARFTTFTHQSWVNWIRNNDTSGKWKDWAEYVNERYGI